MPRLTPLALPALLAAVLAAGCGDSAPAGDPRDAQIADLTRAVEELRASNEDLATEVRRQGRQLAGFDRVRIAPGDAAGAPASAPPPTDGGTATGTATAVDANASFDFADPASRQAVAELLETEVGQKAIARATARELERREQRDRRLAVSYQVGMFAREAGLDDRQTERLQEIWKTSLDRGVELRTQFAAIGKLPESEREEARTQAMQAMRDIGRERNESVAEVLNSAQLEMYAKTDEEIVEGLHGGPRR